MDLNDLDAGDECPECSSPLFSLRSARPYTVIDYAGLSEYGKRWVQTGVWCPACQWSHHWEGGKERIVPMGAGPLWIEPDDDHET